MFLLKKSQNPQISLALSEDVALFIASHVTSNVRDLEGALLKLKAFVDFSKIFSNAPPLKSLKPSSIKSIPIKKIAIPDIIVFESSLPKGDQSLLFFYKDP